MSDFAADLPMFVNDAEAIIYFEAHGIGHYLDESGAHVEQVTFDETDDVDGLLGRLKGLEHIRKLAFHENTVSVGRMRIVAAQFPELMYLVIKDNGQVPVAVYEELREITNLRGFTRSVPMTLNIGTVHLIEFPPPDPKAAEKLRAIFALKHLDWLYLERMDVDGIDFAPIRQFRDLKTLVLSQTNLMDAQLAHVGQLTKLTWLNLARTKVTDDGVKHLEDLSHLEYLSLWENVGITDKSALSLLKLRNLEELESMDTEIGDETLQILARHPSLKRLNISGTRITDEGLQALANLKHLETLSVEMTRVTEEGVGRLRKALPKCHIDTNPPESMGEHRTSL